MNHFFSFDLHAYHDTSANMHMYIPSCRTLSCFLTQLGCNHIGDAGAQAFAQLLLSEQSKLKWLALGANNISVQGARYLGVGLRAYGPRALRQAARQLQGYTHPSPILRRHPSMTSSMSSRSQGYLDDVTEEESNDSASYSSEEETTFCCSLESLGLGGNNIRDEGARAIAEGLVSNTSKHTS